MNTFQWINGLAGHLAASEGVRGGAGGRAIVEGMTGLRASRRHLYGLACGLAVAAIVGAYSNHFRNDFHFDDFHTIQNNLYIRNLRNVPLFFESARTFSSKPSNQSYRPFLTTTLAIDYRLGQGLNPVVFHGTSFALFLIQSAAMLVLFRRIMGRARPHRWNRWLALFAAAWYGLHTANAETVNYIIARSDILSTLGAVLALLMFTGGGRARRWGLYLIPAAAGVLSKEQGAMAAPLIFLYVALIERELTIGQLLRPRQIAAVLRDTWPVFLVCGALAVVDIRMADTWVPGETSRLSYLLTQPFVMAHYAFEYVLPVSLSADTDWTPIANPLDGRVLVGVVFIASALWLAVVMSRRRDTRPIAFGILWFFVALLPTSSVVPMPEVMNDHRMYFPFVGVTLAVAWAAGIALMHREPLGAARRWAGCAGVSAGVAILVAHAYGTTQRNAVWHTEASLWLDVITKSPENGRGLMNYGLIQMENGNLSVADEYFERALQYSPRYATLHVNLGVLRAARGNRSDAERHFRLAQQYDPDNPNSYLYYGRWLRSIGRSDEAAAALRRSLELSPANVEARHLLLDILGDRAEWRNVESIARDTLRIEPGDAAAAAWLSAARGHGPSPDSRPILAPEQWLAMSLLQYRNGEYEDAVESSRRALQLRLEYPEAYNAICAAKNALGDYKVAAMACERALAIKPDFLLARTNLAAAQSKRRGPE